MVLLQAEDYGHNEARTYGLTLLATRLPLRHSLDHTDCLPIELGVYALDGLYLRGGAITLYDEADHDLTLDTVVHGALGVLDILGQVLHEGFHPTGELGLLLYDLEDGLVYFLVRIDVLSPEGDVGRR